MIRQSYAATLTSRARARALLARPRPAVERELVLADLEILPRVLVEQLGEGARIADEIDPRLAWQSIRELVDDLVAGGLTGAGALEAHLELLELTPRARYDRVRRELDRLVDLELVIRSPVNAEPRPRVLVYKLATFPA